MIQRLPQWATAKNSNNRLHGCQILTASRHLTKFASRLDEKRLNTAVFAQRTATPQLAQPSYPDPAPFTEQLAADRQSAVLFQLETNLSIVDTLDTPTRHGRNHLEFELQLTC